MGVGRKVIWVFLVALVNRYLDSVSNHSQLEWLVYEMIHWNISNTMAQNKTHWNGSNTIHWNESNTIDQGI